MPGNDPIGWASDVASGLGDAFESAAKGGSSGSKDSDKDTSDKDSSDKGDSDKK